MRDTTILYAGIFCLALVLLAMVLTVYEFRKFSSRESASDVERTLATEREARAVAGPLLASKVAALRPSHFISPPPKGVLHDQSPAP